MSVLHAQEVGGSCIVAGELATPAAARHTAQHKHNNVDRAGEFNSWFVLFNRQE